MQSCDQSALKLLSSAADGRAVKLIMQSRTFPPQTTDLPSNMSDAEKNGRRSVGQISLNQRSKIRERRGNYVLKQADMPTDAG